MCKTIYIKQCYYYNVLTIDNGDKLVLGNKDSSLFDILSSQLGTLASYLFIGLIIYMVMKFVKGIKDCFVYPPNPYDWCYEV